MHDPDLRFNRDIVQQHVQANMRQNHSQANIAQFQINSNDQHLLESQQLVQSHTQRT